MGAIKKLRWTAAGRDLTTEHGDNEIGAAYWTGRGYHWLARRMWGTGDEAVDMTINGFEASLEGAKKCVETALSRKRWP